MMIVMKEGASQDQVDAIVARVESVGATAHVSQGELVTVIERVGMEDELADRGLEFAESQANFSWVSLGDREEDAVMESLAKQGVIVRGGKSLGAEGFIRVTYGTSEENKRFLAALDEALRA